MRPDKIDTSVVSITGVSIKSEYASAIMETLPDGMTLSRFAIIQLEKEGKRRYVSRLDERWRRKTEEEKRQIIGA